MRRTLALFAALTLTCPATAAGYQNGRVPASALAPVNTGAGFEASADKRAAAAWNVAQHCAGGRNIIAGPRSAYRTYAEQEHFWRLWRSGRGNLAARPGTSNHGWGLAFDLGNHSTRARVQAARALVKYEAPGEWWHLNWRGAVLGPDPGPSLQHPTLRQGSRGCVAPAVREAQRRLAVRPVSGTFGPGTAAAVLRFERAHGWQAPDGVVTYATWVKLRRQAVARRGRGWLGPATPAMAGADVLATQRLLNLRLAEHGSRTRVEPDSVFGPATTRAVREFQRYRNITPVSGVVGPRTREELERPIARAAPTAPAATPGPGKPVFPRMTTTVISRHQGERWTRVGAIVIHTTEGWDRGSPTGDLNSALGYFRSNPREVSAHYTVDRLGQIGRSVESARRAYHAGRHNTYTIGIEQVAYAGYPSQTWKGRTRQLDAVAALIAAEAVAWGVPIRRCATNPRGDLTAHGVCSHAQLDPRGRTDPGAAYPWAYVLERARALAGAAG